MPLAALLSSIGASAKTGADASAGVTATDADAMQAEPLRAVSLSSVLSLTAAAARAAVQVR